MVKNVVASQSGIQDVKSRALFVLFAIFIFRLGSHIPIPGIDYVKLAVISAQTQTGLFGFLNVMSGGALARMSLFTLSLSPYISASIAMQMLVYIVPYLEQLKKEGGKGRHKITQYTRFFALALALVQSIPVSRRMISMGVVIEPGTIFFLVSAATLATGTMFLLWMGEQITERGIGNGISVIIFAGICSRFPEAISHLYELVVTGEMNVIVFLTIISVVVLITAGVVFVEKAQRQIKITHPSRHQVRSSQTHVLPLKINMSGVIPPIFATTLVFVPFTIMDSLGFGQNVYVQSFMGALYPGQPLYIIVMVSAIAFFSFLYTSLMINPNEIAENLKKGGVLIPGLRPGVQTAKYIDEVLKRITFFGILYLSFVVLAPEIFVKIWKIPFSFGGTSLLIVVVVVMDFMSQLSAHLLPDRYASLVEKPGKAGGKQNLQLFR
jgi:preprotein translocase subunit SecY